MHIQISNISSQRWSAFIIAGIAVLLFVMHIGANTWMVVLAAVGFFLGITDYGRQCPLWLSLHHLLVRIRKKS